MSGAVLASSGAAWALESYVTSAVGKRDVAGLGKGADSGPKGAMNILVAGVDRRDGLSKAQQNELHLGHDAGERSDTMMLVHLSANHDRVTVVSLPRDSYVLIPEHKSNGNEGAKGADIPARYGKLTWTYQFGGPDLTVATIKKATGLSIDHYIEVNFVGFVKMVDAVGGVDICTPTAINDAKSGLKLPAGKSHVNGVKALGFARARYTLGDGSDLGRIDRQQEFMASMMRQALSVKTLSNPASSLSFLHATLGALTVDKKLASGLPALADQLKSLSTDNVTFAKIPLADSDFRTVLWNASLPQSTVQWDRQGSAELFGDIKHDQPVIKPQPTASASTSQGPQLTVPPDKISVRVWNGAGTRGLAAQAATDLRKAGFGATVVPGTYKKTGLTTTLIQYGPARADSAKTLAAALPGAKLKEVASLGSGIQVIVGSDWNGAKKVKVTTATPSTPASSVSAKTATQNVLCK
jgi:LCP family protein required for cell wall assembly